MAIEINLLHQHKTSQFAQRAIKTLRIATILMGVGVMSALMILFYLTQDVESKLTERSEHQKDIMARIAKNQDKETSALLLNEKYKEVDLLLKAEPSYLSYFDILMKELPNASGSGRIGRLAINSRGEASVQIGFPDILALSKFLTRAESDEFKDNFSSIRTSGISFDNKSSKELTFSLDVKF